jgi:hypothetical protein
MSFLATPELLTTVGGDQEAVPGPVTDPRADALRRRYHELFGGEELPVPVESIAEDLLGLSINEDEQLPVSGMLLPAERQIWVDAGEAQESPGRRRFTLAHEVGHWVCQCLEGRSAPVYCRAEDVGAGTDRTLEREANVFAAELLMPEPALRVEFAQPPSNEGLAARLGVSEEAMHWRLFNFGELLAELASFPGRIALMPAEPLSRDVMLRMATAVGEDAVSVGQALTEVSTPLSPTEVTSLLRPARFLVDLDILAWPELGVNLIQLVRLLARSQPRVALWPGAIRDERARYSEPGRQDYIDEALADVIVLRPRPVSFPDEVPFTTERIPA